MKFFIGLIWLAIISLINIAHSHILNKAINQPPFCTMFLYSNEPIYPEMLHAYNWIIVNPDYKYFNDIKNLFYFKHKAKFLAYISVGEKLKISNSAFVLGKNKIWNSYIMDIRNPLYQKELLNQFDKLASKGFSGFFLDTIESYKLVLNSSKQESYKKALIEFIKKLRKRYPNKIILINRGFDLLPYIHKYINGIVIESMFYKYNSKFEYISTPPNETKELVKKALVAKRYGLKVIVIDYLPNGESHKISKDLQQIASLGFVPYIADKYLKHIGYSLCTPIPRKILLLYDSKISQIPQNSDIHRLVQMPLEYLGFVPVLWDINKPLPYISKANGFVGVITMYISSQNLNEKFYNWLVQVKNRGLKIFFLKSIPITNEQILKSYFGIQFKYVDNPSNKIFFIEKYQKGFGFEIKPKAIYSDVVVIPLKGTPYLITQNRKGQKNVPFALTSWGGYAIANSLLNESLWVFDPFKVFKKVFSSERFPIPDVTTENGRRILIAHIDGDGFAERSWFRSDKTTGEIIRDEILKKFPIPHTVSVIVGEIAPNGLYPKKAKKLEKIAISIFKLKNVEKASHSYSHPFTWQPEIEPPDPLYGYHLPIPGYKWNPYQEIIGSIEFLNKLYPKKKTKVFLWTGNCDPNKEEIKLTYEARVFNLNGGDTTITKDKPFLKNIAPLGVNFGPYYFQVYAPNQNEEIYTNEWKYPLWGFIKVLQTFELTDKPRRLKPVDIYYHFYSAQRLVAFNALKFVYKKVLSWNLNPMFVSDYVKKVWDFRDTAILKTKGGFFVKNSGYLRTLRIPKSFGFIDLKHSKGVIGFKNFGDFYYVHLDNSGNYYIAIDNKPTNFFNLIEATGIVENFKKEKNFISFTLKSYLPIKGSLYTGPCEVFINNKTYTENKTVKFLGGKTIEVKAICSN